MGTVLKLGIGGVVGLLAGLALVAWVRPATQGGQALLVVISVAIGSAVWAALAAALARRKQDR